MNTTSAQPTQSPYSYVDAYTPPASDQNQSVQPPMPPSVSAAQVSPLETKGGEQSEQLEDQNIFFLLGVQDGTPEQRESFLDELQQVIWEDFLEYDVKLLVTTSEQQQLDALLADSQTKDLEKQEKIVVFLEKLIPDLEEIMLEKALELKEEMARERVKSLKDIYNTDSEKLSAVTKAEELMNTNKWFSAATLLNSVS